MEYVYAIPLGLSAICAYTDLKTSLILNKITIPMALLGFVFSALTGRIVESLLGFAIGFGIMLVGVLKGGAGAGDAKLAGALGAWLGLGVLQAILIACAAGFGWGLVRLQKAGTLKTRTILFFRGIYCRFVFGMRGVVPISTLLDEDVEKLPPEAIPFGMCLAAGAWIIWTIIIFQGAGIKVVW